MKSTNGSVEVAVNTVVSSNSVIMGTVGMHSAALMCLSHSDLHMKLALLYTVTLSQECIQTGVVHHCSCDHLFNHEMMLLAASMTDAAFSSDCKYTLLSE